MATRILSFEKALYEALDFIPLGVRRKLDLAGRKLSLEGWRRIDVAARRALAGAEVSDEASLAAFARALEEAASSAGVELTALALEGAPRWRSASVPAPVAARLAEQGAALDDDAWRALDDEARYLLTALAEKRREPERFDAATHEILRLLPVDLRARR